MPDISFPINPRDLNLNKLGLSPSNYLYGKRREPKDEMFRTLMIRLVSFLSKEYAQIFQIQRQEISYQK